MPRRKYKVILDTNVLVSGVLSEGSSFELLALWKKGCFDIIVCAEILEEYFSVLSRDKFCLPAGLVKTILNELSQNGIRIVKTSRIKIIKNDPADNKFIEAAFDANADYIVSGDKHLLKLSKFNNIPIISPNVFYNLLK